MNEFTDRQAYTAPVLESLAMAETRSIDIGIGIGVGAGVGS